MPTGPPDPSPPVEADFGPSHDAITAELLDLTWQFLTHAAPTVRAELGQFLADHGQHPVAGLGAFPTAYSSAPHGTTQATHTASEHHQDQQAGPILTPTTRVRTAQVGPKLLPTWGQKSFSKSGATCRSVTTSPDTGNARRVWHLILVSLQ
jgi:hypothetical protein